MSTVHDSRESDIEIHRKRHEKLSGIFEKFWIKEVADDFSVSSSLGTEDIRRLIEFVWWRGVQEGKAQHERGI